MKCFYHSADTDGHCSGAIIKLRFPECELYPINYGEPFPWEIITNPKERVYVVDFCLQPFSDMVKLNDMCQLVWIDHHKSAIEEYLKSNVSIKGLRNMEHAACYLVWSFIYGVAQQPPYQVTLLSNYDIWDHTDPLTLPFQYGIRMYETDPSKDEGMDTWRAIFYRGVKEDSIVASVVNEGSTIIKYIERENRLTCDVCSYELEFEGYKCIAINKMLTSSNIFDSAEGDYDIKITFGYRGGKWFVSLYSDKVDVSEIAKKYGGGGHKGAAGFQLTTTQIVMVLKGDGNR